MDQRTYLKVKVKSLAEEAKIIRKEIKNAKLESVKNGLYLHKVDVVRPEARATHLAYGFLKGLEYKQIEHDPKTEPNWNRVLTMVKKYCYHHEDGTPYQAGLAREEAEKKFKAWKCQAEHSQIK